MRRAEPTKPTTDDQAASIESLLLDYAKRLARHPGGRRGIVIHLSRLRADNRREHHIRIAANTFEALVKQFDGQIFLLQNADIVFVCKDASIAVIDDAIMRLRYLFGDDPLAAELDESAPDRFATWYDLERDYQEFLALTEEMSEQALKRKKRLAAIAGGGPRNERQPMDAPALAELVTMIQRADLSNVMRRQSICAIMGDEAPEPVFREIYVSIAELRDTLMPKRDIASDRWLFQHLTQHLDRRVLAMLRKNDDQVLAHSYSLNLNISTLLSQEFHQFDQSLRAGARGTIVIELQKVDIFADLGAYLFARDFLKERGYRRLPRRRLRGDAGIHRPRAPRPRPPEDVLDAGHGRPAAHRAHDCLQGGGRAAPAARASSWRAATARTPSPSAKRSDCACSRAGISTGC